MLCDQNEREFAQVQEVLNGTRSGPRVKITQDVRDFAADKGVGVEVAVEEGMKAKAKEFRDQGSEIYKNT